jgi:Xaa-Pro aminopeptidase
VISPALNQLRLLLAEHKLDAVLISSPTNRRYLSGYTAEDHAPDESSGLLLISKDQAVLFTSNVNADWAKAEALSFEVVPCKRPWEPGVIEHAVKLGLNRIGFEDRATIVSSHAALASASETVIWTPLEGTVDALRACKSKVEIDDLARAMQLTDFVFAEVAASIVPGESEASVAWKIERLTREMTEGTVAFEPIVASGRHAARPHHAATDRAIQEREPIVIDMGVASNGYRGDLTRTICLGEPTERLREVYNVVYQAQRAAIAAVGPGVPVKQVDQTARDAIEAAGFGEFILHSVGHGLGLRVHEAPSVSTNSDAVLEPGNVVTIEPGIYIPDWGGVRIEDVCVVTESGRRNLTTAAVYTEWIER